MLQFESIKEHLTHYGLHSRLIVNYATHSIPLSSNLYCVPHAVTHFIL
jgi:hypothetical protein